MKAVLAAVLTVALMVTACGSDEPDAAGVGLEGINRCNFEAGSAPYFMVLEQEFPMMQAAIRENGAESLTAEHKQLFNMFYEFTVINGGGFNPEVLGPLYIPGDTTLAELRDQGGVREVERLAGTAAQIWLDDWLEFKRQYSRELELACSALWPETLEVLCRTGSEASKERACPDLDEYPNRELATIVEACEQVPYLYLCDPENSEFWAPDLP